MSPPHGDFCASYPRLDGLCVARGDAERARCALSDAFDAFTLDFVELSLVESTDDDASADSVAPFLHQAWGEAYEDVECVRALVCAARQGGSARDAGENSEMIDAPSEPSPSTSTSPSASVRDTTATVDAPSTTTTTTNWTASLSTTLEREFESEVTRVARRVRPTSADSMRACVRRAFAACSRLIDDDDAFEYVVSIVMSDVEERECSFEETLRGVIDAYDLDVDCERACDELRRALDSQSTTETTKTKQPTAAVVGDAGVVRKLAQVVKIGGDNGRRSASARDSVDAAAGVVGGDGFWEQEQRKQQQEHEERMQKIIDANAALVEQKRAKKAEKHAKARAAAAAAAATMEAQNMEQLSMSASHSKGASSKVGSRDISVSDFSVPHPRGGDDLLEGTQLSLTHGHRYGLCGRNGCGKSTLLRLLAMKRVPGVPADLRIMYVSQDSSDEFAHSELNPIEVLVKSDTRREYLNAQLAELQNHEDVSVDVSIEKRVREIVDELKAIGAADAHERARKVLRGLQFDPAKMERPVSALSGGWRVRVSLARALFVAPDCLLLDEPTNHLDLEACLWLEQYMCDAFDGRTLVVVSHDRSFLNAVCTDVLAIQNKKLTAYAGDFATYECVRDEQAERQQKMFDEQQAKKKQMQKFVDKHLHKGSTSMFDDGNAKKAKEMMKKMDRMGAMGHDGKKWKLSYDGVQKELTAPDTEGGGFKFAFPDPGVVPGSSESVQLRDVSFTYGGDPGSSASSSAALFHGLSFPIDCTTRLALVGKNGAGKSTLMKLVYGTLEPTRGNIFRSGRLRLSYVTQHHVDQLDLSATPLEYVLRIAGIERDVSSQSYEIEDEQNARRRLGRFGISGHLQTQTINLLSGGQRSRVAWAVATSNDPHIILLDEPTNHLDYDSVNALIDACNAFEGGLVFVSHDEHFVTSVENVNVLEVTGDGAPGATSYADDFESYKKKAIKALRKWIA